MCGIYDIQVIVNTSIPQISKNYIGKYYLER